MAQAESIERVNVRYVGNRPVRRDNVCGTKLVWQGPGEVLPVSKEVAQRLLRHPDVWRKEEEPWVAPTARSLEPSGSDQEAIALGILVRAGDWEGVETLFPRAFERAVEWFIGEHAVPAPGSSDEALVQGWARDLLAGSESAIRERIQEQAALLQARPGLCAVLASAEETGKNRRGVMDLLLETEARLGSPQADLLDGPDGSLPA